MLMPMLTLKLVPVLPLLLMLMPLLRYLRGCTMSLRRPSWIARRRAER